MGIKLDGCSKHHDLCNEGYSEYKRFDDQHLEWGLSEQGVGLRPAWKSCCSWCDFISETGAIYIPCFTYLLFHHPFWLLTDSGVTLERNFVFTTKHFLSWPLETNKHLLHHGDTGIIHGLRQKCIQKMRLYQLESSDVETWEARSSV